MEYILALMCWGKEEKRRWTKGLGVANWPSWQKAGFFSGWCGAQKLVLAAVGCLGAVLRQSGNTSHTKTSETTSDAAARSKVSRAKCGFNQARTRV